MNIQSRKPAAPKAVTRLTALHDYGQAPWLDFLARKFIAEGGLKELVERDGVTGVTSNPSIFEKAIGESDDYDEALKAALAKGDRDVMSLYEALDQLCIPLHTSYEVKGTRILIRGAGCDTL